MGELRKDYILDRWVIISSARGKRPHELKVTEEIEQKGTCFFCPGNENLTPPEIGRIKANNSWKMRWFENKFAALQPEGQSFIKLDNRFFKFSANYGYHEVLVHTPVHTQHFAELPVEDLAMVLHVYRDRINALSKLPNIKYVNVFKNHGAQGGTSIVHSHSQIMATNFVPDLVLDEVRASRKFVECPYCKIVEIERRSLRRCFENETFLAFTPYASRFNYECWIFPKQHKKSLNDLNEDQLLQLASILKDVLQKIRAISITPHGVSYNLWLHYAPEGDDLHFHIEIAPRIAVWGGFELCTNAVINSVSPEDAAAYYRGEQ